MRRKLKWAMISMAIWIYPAITALLLIFFIESQCLKYGSASMVFFSDVKMTCEPQPKEF